METGIAKAVRIAGSQTALGKLLGLTPQAIQKWTVQGVVPGDRCLEVEAKLGCQVTRYELNPTVFGQDPSLDGPVLVQRDNKGLAFNPHSRSKDDMATGAVT
jgi:DNA-binding transcriptional regulator YdaS (Cro superfamily)